MNKRKKTHNNSFGICLISLSFLFCICRMYFQRWWHIVHCSAHMITEAFVSKHNKCRRYTYAFFSLLDFIEHSVAQQSSARWRVHSWRVHCDTVEHCCRLVATDAAAIGQMHISHFSLILNLSYLLVSHYFFEKKLSKYFAVKF